MANRARPRTFPPKLAVLFLNRDVVDRSVALSHIPQAIKLPIFVAVGAEPVVVVIAPFVAKSYSDSVRAIVRPNFFDETVIVFIAPFPCKKFHHFPSSRYELGAIAPPSISCVRQRYPLRVSAIPCVLGHPYLLHSVIETKRWHGRLGSAFSHVSRKRSYR